MDRRIEIQTSGQTGGGQIDRWMDERTDDRRKISIQCQNRQADRQAGIQLGRETDRTKRESSERQHRDGQKVRKLSKT